jgi:hypothetical protein
MQRIAEEEMGRKRRAWKPRSFDEQDRPPELCQGSGSDAASDPGSHDDHIESTYLLGHTPLAASGTEPIQSNRRESAPSRY